MGQFDDLSYDDPRLPQWAKAKRDVPYGAVEREGHDHADPMYCVCGHTWGYHGEPDGGCSPVWIGKIKHECYCDRFRYDLDNPENAYCRPPKEPLLPKSR